MKNAMSPVVLQTPGSIPESLNGVHQVIQIRDEGQLDSIYIDVPGSRFCVLFCHNLDGHLYMRVPILEKLQEMGLSVLAVDFRGFGASSPVEITDETLQMDLKYAFDAVLRKRWNPAQIILYGQGLSAGIQGLMPEGKTFGGWILDNPVPSLSDASADRLTRALTEGRLSLYDQLASFSGPVMTVIDPVTFPDTFRTALSHVHPGVRFCESQGRRIPGSWETADWDSWTACMHQFLDQMAMLPNPEGHSRIPPKKTAGDIAPATESRSDGTE